MQGGDTPRSGMHGWRDRCSTTTRRNGGSRARSCERRWPPGWTRRSGAWWSAPRRRRVYRSTSGTRRFSRGLLPSSRRLSARMRYVMRPKIRDGLLGCRCLHVVCGQIPNGGFVGVGCPKKRGCSVSLEPCKHDGRQRPVDVTCARRCERFPKCMPPESTQLKDSIRGTLQAGAVERAAVVALLGTLDVFLKETATTEKPEG